MAAYEMRISDGISNLCSSYLPRHDQFLEPGRTGYVGALADIDEAGGLGGHLGLQTRFAFFVIPAKAGINDHRSPRTGPARCSWFPAFAGMQNDGRVILGTKMPPEPSVRAPTCCGGAGRVGAWGAQRQHTASA